MGLQPDFFDDVVVLNQLHYNGITQIAIIRKMGFAVRVEYTDFVRKYVINSLFHLNAIFLIKGPNLSGPIGSMHGLRGSMSDLANFFPKIDCS